MNPLLAALMSLPSPSVMTLAPTFQGSIMALAGMLARHRAESTATASIRRPTVVSGVAVIQARGLLINWAGLPDWCSGWITGYGDIRAQARMARNDPEIRGVVLDVNSGGGEVAGCFDTVDELSALSAEKPVMAILDEVAYSAGYALASAANVIAVPRTGGVGSIGVVTMHIDWSAALAEAGVAVTLIQAGKHKTDGNPFQALPEEVRTRIQAEIEEVRTLFAATVARNRGLDVADVLATEALTYSAAEGVKLGLADVVASEAEAWAAMMQEIAAG